MSDDPLDAVVAEHFGDLRYPGSRHVRQGLRAKEAVPIPQEGDWDANPRILPVNGEDVEFFTIGALATALERSPVTIREWESKGIIPKARFQIPGKDGLRGKRRLYTRPQIEGIILIAREEKILGVKKVKDFTETDFTSRVVKLFEETGL